MILIARLGVGRLFWRDVRALPAAWVAVMLTIYLALRGSLAPPVGLGTAASWTSLIYISGVLSLPLA